MNKELAIPFSSIKNTVTNTFAFQCVLTLSHGKRQYRFGNEWFDHTLGKRPDETRITMELETFRKARNAYKIWNQLTPSFTFNPVFPEIIMARLMNGEPLTLFVPWGVRDTAKIGQRERLAMNTLESFACMLHENGVNTQIVIMPADIYALEINKKISPLIVSEYFTQVTDESRNRGFIVMPWSQIRYENQTLYDQISLEMTQEHIATLISLPVRMKAYEAALRNSGFQDAASIQRSAYTYLRERICEAIIVEETLKPIKVSMAPKNKDNDVDMSLPRLYILPEKLILPWKGDL